MQVLVQLSQPLLPDRGLVLKTLVVLRVLQRGQQWLVVSHLIVTNLIGAKLDNDDIFLKVYSWIGLIQYNKAFWFVYDRLKSHWSFADCWLSSERVASDLLLAPSVDLKCHLVIECWPGWQGPSSLWWSWWLSFVSPRSLWEWRVRQRPTGQAPAAPLW